MAIVCSGITGYDVRVSVKAVAAEALTYGESVRISTDGLAYAVDNGKSDVCHGWVLESCAAGDMVTIVNKCRMTVDTAQTIGARAYTGATAGGSAPSTTVGTGIIVGYAWQANKLMLVAPVPAADG